MAIERSLECEILSKEEFMRPVLDLGCGDGVFASVLFDENIDIGVDPDESEIKEARERGIYKEVIKCPGDKIPKEAGSVATIFSNSVLEHISELRPVLDEASRLLAKEGRFYVTVPTDLFDKYSVIYQILSVFRLNVFAESYRKFFNKFWKHFNYHKKKDWESIFLNSGFKIVESEEYCSKTICLLNDFLIPFAFFAFVTKKLIKRWIIFPGIRKIYIYPFYLVIRNIVKKYKGSTKGAIIFFSLVKK